jgi:hypothetical protein
VVDLKLQLVAVRTLTQSSVSVIGVLQTVNSKVSPGPQPTLADPPPSVTLLQMWFRAEFYTHGHSPEAKSPNETTFGPGCVTFIYIYLR